MPGGQATVLREQAESMGLGARWKEVARTYAEVNDLGDIVKVTPSSKVVGDMTMFVTPADCRRRVNLEPGATPFPQSVIDMMKGRQANPRVVGRARCRRWCSENRSRSRADPVPISSR